MTNTIRALLKLGIDQLRAAHIPSYTLAAELLLLHAAGRDRTWLYSHPEETLSKEATENYFSLLHRRVAGEPTQHLTGHQEFWGLDFEVSPDVLIPRPETEHLIEVTLDRLAVLEIRSGRDPRLTGKNLSIIDVGTGSGCIAVALAKELPDATIHAVDISPKALAVATRNAAKHDVANRIQFAQSNLLDAFSHSFTSNPEAPPFLSAIVSNPPYIGLREAPTLSTEVRDHEPHQALFGGEEGYELYSDLILQSAKHLKPGGLLVLELGHSSLPAVQPLFDSASWTNLHVTKDLSGVDRILSVEKI